MTRKPSSDDPGWSAVIGTGVVARLAARRAGASGRIAASDVSEAMLAHSARQPLPEGSAPIESVEAPAAALPFPADSFDAVLCQQGLQFFAERLDAVREMSRVVRAGGGSAPRCGRRDTGLSPSMTMRRL